MDWGTNQWRINSNFISQITGIDKIVQIVLNSIHLDISKSIEDSYKGSCKTLSPVYIIFYINRILYIMYVWSLGTRVAGIVSTNNLTANHNNYLEKILYSHEMFAPPPSQISS